MTYSRPTDGTRTVCCDARAACARTRALLLLLLLLLYHIKFVDGGGSGGGGRDMCTVQPASGRRVAGLTARNAPSVSEWVRLN